MKILITFLLILGYGCKPAKQKKIEEAKENLKKIGEQVKTYFADDNELTFPTLDESISQPPTDLSDILTEPPEK